MTTRREFFRLAVQSATAAAMLTGNHSATAEQNEVHRATPRRGRPLLDLQQRFVDLRFGMFLHFNMATFQDREWGDPTSPPDLFHPAALDTDQWAAAAQSAGMTWGCLTTRHHDGFCMWPTKTWAASVLCDLNASQYPSGGLYYSDVKAFEQNAGQKVPEDSDVPALSCVTLTDGWFWKQRDANGHLKAVTTVVNEWLEPLNRRHCNLILNAPPTREGRLAPNVVSRLEEIGKSWKHPGPMAELSEHVVITTRNLATGKPIHASSYPDTVGPDEANDGDSRSSWYLDEGQTSGWLEVDLGKQESFNVVSLVEPVGRWDDYLQSRIRNYHFQHWNGTGWITLAGGETPAPTTIHRIPRVASQRVRLLLESNKEMPHIAEIGVYDEPA
jgi:alpha-L-fucosidase